MKVMPKTETPGLLRLPGRKPALLRSGVSFRWRVSHRAENKQVRPREPLWGMARVQKRVFA